MLTKTYHLKFTDFESALCAAPLVIDALRGFIWADGLSGPQVRIGDGESIDVTVYFDSRAALLRFEEGRNGFFKRLQVCSGLKDVQSDGASILAARRKATSAVA